MNYKEMLPLMGQIVTVKAVWRRRLTSTTERGWLSHECKPWAGWVVGFRYKLNGKVVYPRYDSFGEEPTTFHETSRFLCVMVAPWPTMNGKPVPLDSYEVGGTPEPPDNGGWVQSKGQR